MEAGRHGVNVTVAAGGYNFVSGVVSGGTVSGYQEIDRGGPAAGIIVASGGTEAVMSGASASAITVSGGREVVSSGGSLTGAFTFAGSGALVVANGANVTATISGFDQTDRFNFQDVNFASATVSLSGGVLNVSDGTDSASVTLAGTYVGSSFVLSNNGTGGTKVTYNAPSGMAAAPIDGQLAQLVQAMAAPPTDGRC